VNDREEIQEAFKTYYESAEMGEQVDPARLYQLKGDWMHRESTWPKSWTEAEAELFAIYTVS
jgi:hypothetical protein